MVRVMVKPDEGVPGVRKEIRTAAGADSQSGNPTPPADLSGLSPRELRERLFGLSASISDFDQWRALAGELQRRAERAAALKEEIAKLYTLIQRRDAPAASRIVAKLTDELIAAAEPFSHDYEGRALCNALAALKAVRRIEAQP